MSPVALWDLGALVTGDVDQVLQRTLAEILGLAQGFCAGRGGSMHLQWLEAGALGTNAIVGGGVPMGAGNSYAQRQSGTTDLTVSYFGDGAVNIGSVLETMNLAAAWTLPFVFFIENNLYAVSTTVAEATGEHRLSGRGPGFGIPSWRVDGMDPLAVHLAMTEVADRIRGGGGPAVVEAEVYRFFHQNGPYPGSAFGYRAKNEEAEWRARDPAGARRQRDARARPASARPRSPRCVPRPSRRCGRSPTASPRPIPTPPASGASGRSCGRTPSSSTWASAATAASWPGVATSSRSRTTARRTPAGSSTSSRA